MPDPECRAVSTVSGGGDEGGYFDAQVQPCEVDPIRSGGVFDHKGMVAVSNAKIELDVGGAGSAHGRGWPALLRDGFIIQGDPEGASGVTDTGYLELGLSGGGRVLMESRPIGVGMGWIGGGIG